MTDPTMTAPPQDRLGAALTEAWHRHGGQPIPEPGRAAFLQAVRDLAATAPVAAHQHPDRDSLDRCQRDLIDQLRELHETIRFAHRRGHGHRTALRQAQLGVRTAVLATLSANPHLEDRLRQALDDWGLPPIPTGFDVTFSVPVSVAVDAVDANDATRLATSRLGEALQRLPAALTAHVDQAHRIDVTEHQPAPTQP